MLENAVKPNSSPAASNADACAGSERDKVGHVSLITIQKAGCRSLFPSFAQNSPKPAGIFPRSVKARQRHFNNRQVGREIEN